MPSRNTHLVRQSPDVVPRATEGPPEAGALRSAFLDCEGERRRYVLYVPARHTGDAPLPLLLNLHGSTSYPEEQMMLSGTAAAADAHGVAVLAPEGLERAWNVPHQEALPSDVAFIEAAIEATARVVPVDFARLWATGFSGGARMLTALVAGLARPLAAIAPVAGLRFSDAIPRDRTPAVIAFHGALDQVNPIEGGGFHYWQTGVADAAARWAKHLGAGEEKTTHEGPVRHTVHAGGSAALEVYTVDDLGHQWPGFPIPLAPPLGPPSRAVLATETMLRFFARVR